MYCKNGGGVRFRKFNGLNLAWWHSYKYCITQIWKQFAAEVFAPLWHNLYPGHTFFRKHGQVSVMAMHVMYLQLAYPAVKQKLHSLLDKDSLHAKSRVYVRDLIFLLELAIPVVQSTRTHNHALWNSTQTNTHS